MSHSDTARAELRVLLRRASLGLFAALKDSVRQIAVVKDEKIVYAASIFWNCSDRFLALIGGEDSTLKVEVTPRTKIASPTSDCRNSVMTGGTNKRLTNF